jgi:hypothetical protein
MVQINQGFCDSCLARSLPASKDNDIILFVLTIRECCAMKENLEYLGAISGDNRNA